MGPRAYEWSDVPETAGNAVPRSDRSAMSLTGAIQSSMGRYPAADADTAAVPGPPAQGPAVDERARTFSPGSSG
jgi:hypothetical protein